jgi:WD40 repeat protein
MFSNQAAEASVNAPARCLAAVRADKTEARFVVGTCSLHEPNEIAVLRFHSDMNELAVDGTIEHPSGPVGVLCMHPTDKHQMLTAAEDNPTVNLWRLPEEVMDKTDNLDYNPDGDGGASAQPTQTYSPELITTLPHDPDSNIVDIVWRDSSTTFDEDSAAPGEVITLDKAGQIAQWDMAASQAVRHEVVADENQVTPPRLAWDPHHHSSVAVTAGVSVHILDWRIDKSLSTGACASFKAHRYGVTDLSFNPNKPHVVATAGQDSLLKFWDLRNAKTPLLSARGAHSHYTWGVEYNPFHDQLVLSSGTDSIVNLWRISTISSAPLLTLDEGDDRPESFNVRVSRFEHGDSVYAMAWGASDAWIYASVGYDGKIALHHVPSKEKYKILL